MRKLYIVKTKEEFNDLIHRGSCKKNKYFVIYKKNNHLKYDRFGISVGKKIGKAVIRNKYKRRIRNILDIYRKDYLNCQDYIIILRSRALNLTYQELEKELLSLLTKEGDFNEKQKEK